MFAGEDVRYINTHTYTHAFYILIVGMYLPYTAVHVYSLQTSIKARV